MTDIDLNSVITLNQGKDFRLIIQLDFWVGRAPLSYMLKQLDEIGRAGCNTQKPEPRNQPLPMPETDSRC